MYKSYPLLITAAAATNVIKIKSLFLKKNYKFNQNLVMLLSPSSRIEETNSIVINTRSFSLSLRSVNWKQTFFPIFEKN